jgi:hypothetical protein
MPCFRERVVDLAMGSVTSEYEARPYDYSQAEKIVVAAFAAYCPDAA